MDLLFDCDHVDAVALSLKFLLHRSDLAGFGRVAELSVMHYH